MAPTFKTGQCTRVLLNATDLSVIFNDSELKRSVDVAEATPYATSSGGCTTDKSYIPGHRDATADFSGMADASTAKVDQIVENALGSSTRQAWTWGPGGSAIGDSAYLGTAVTSDWTITSPAQDVVACSASVQFGAASTGGGRSPGVKGGAWLLSPAAVTSTAGVRAGVVMRQRSTAAAAPAYGGVIHVHVVSGTTSTGTVKVQHSTDGASWADVVTHAFSSGASFARYVTSTAAIKEQVRANVTAISPAGARIGIAYAPHLT